MKTFKWSIIKYGVPFPECGDCESTPCVCERSDGWFC